MAAEGAVRLNVLARCGLYMSKVFGRRAQLNDETPPPQGLVLGWKGHRLHAVQAVIDGAEGVADDRAQDHERRNYNNGNQNKNERILYQALAFLFRGE
jgi:hypothetical protein